MRRVSPILKVALIIPLGTIVLLMVCPKTPKNVGRITQADPEIQAASLHAQDTLPEFIKQLDHPKAGARYAVKGGFRTSAGNEYLWVAGLTLKGSTFAGTLDEEPAVAREHHKGDKVSVDRKDVYDWIIYDNGQIQGGFTDEVLMKRAK